MARFGSRFCGILCVLGTLLTLGAAVPITGFSLRQYPPGRVYNYLYTTDTLLNDELGKGKFKDVGISFSAAVELAPMWNNNHMMLVKMTVTNPKIHSIAQSNKDRALKGLPRLPIFFEWADGKIGRVYAAEDDSILSVNIKKGVISMLQLRTEDGMREEVDTSGECKVHYKTERDKVTKVKKNCTPSETTGEFTNVNPLLQLGVVYESKTNYDLKDDVIQAASSTEKYTATANMRDTLGAIVEVKQTLKFKSIGSGDSVKASDVDGAIKQVKKKTGLKLLSGVATSVYDVKQCGDQSEKAAELVSQYRDVLVPENTAHVDTASVFLELVSAFRESPQKVLLAILKDTKNNDVIRTLIDAMSATQTSASQAALLEFLNFNDEYEIELAERYLLGVAFSTHPSQSLLNDLFNLYKKTVPSEKLRESIMGALGAVTNTYVRMGHDNVQIVQDIRNTLVNSLDTCKEDNCRSMNLRALMNAGIPDTVPILVKIAESSSDYAECEVAIRGLRRMGDHFITQPVREAMMRIYTQEKRGYDTAVRSKALQILMDTSPTKEDLRKILEQSLDPWNTEFATSINARVFDAAARDQKLKKTVKEILGEPQFRNWNKMAPKGKGLMFTGYMAQTQSANASYKMYVENSKPGIMKRSGMDVDLFNNMQSLPVYNFGIFSAGLESLLGEEVEPGQEEIAATAGISLDLLDVSLRPITFFTGQSGLMSAVWSAPSEPTSALQANVLLHDHYQRVHLQNGLIMEGQIMGAVSVDLSGSLAVSLWNKNAKSLIKNSGSIYIGGSMSIMTSSFRTGVELSASGASVINFKSDVDFYDGIKTCLQMMRPDFNFVETITKFEHAKGFKKGYIARRKRTKFVPAISFPLPKPNNRMCRKMMPTD